MTADGFDIDELSIDLAKKNAEAVGVSDRVNFSTEDVSALLLEDLYDLAIVVEAIHDMSAPVGISAVGSASQYSSCTSRSSAVQDSGRSVRCANPEPHPPTNPSEGARLQPAESLRRSGTTAHSR